MGEAAGRGRKTRRFFSKKRDLSSAYDIRKACKDSLNLNLRGSDIKIAYPESV